MDNPDRMPPVANRQARFAYGPDRRLVAGFVVGSVLFGVLAIAAGDAPGRLLYGLAAITLLLLAAGDLLACPRLVVEAGGLTLRTPISTSRWTWAEVEHVRVDERARLGLAARTLEIDAGERLIVLSGRSLGTDPRVVAAVVAAFRDSWAG